MVAYVQIKTIGVLQWHRPDRLPEALALFLTFCSTFLSVPTQGGIGDAKAK
jgi:hypothetical protein